MRRRNPSVTALLRGLIVSFGLGPACAGCGLSTQCTSELPLCSPPPHGARYHEQSYADEQKQEARAREFRHSTVLAEFLEGTACECSDATCGVAASAARYCAGKPRECVDEILLNTSGGGYIRLLPGAPRRLERVGSVVDAGGVPQRILLNRAPVLVQDSRSRTTRALRSITGGFASVPILSPAGTDVGQLPLTAPLRVEQAKRSDADLTVDGVDYICPDPADASSKRPR